MAFTKITKTPSYYSRFQVKPRRRREGKTDYRARRNLVRQDKRKYNTPKYRFVVRFTNTRCICQVVYATIQGDRIVAQADSSELTRYGMPVGHTNYAASYATGLLCARRVLKRFDLDKDFEGKVTPDGEEYHVEDEDYERRPFKAFLDIGLVMTTTGNRVFGAMKGAVDGGMHIPHSTKRFPGFVSGEDGAKSTYDAETHRKRIFGLHVAEYMKEMAEEDPDKYQAHFARYIKAQITADNLEEKYKAVHSAIRENCEREQKQEKNIQKAVRDGNYIVTVGADGSTVRYLRPQKLSGAQRYERVQKKLAELAKMAAAAAEEDEE